MSPRIRLTLWAGCALVGALELPRSGGQLVQDVERVWQRSAASRWTRPVSDAAPRVAGEPSALEVAFTVLHDESTPHELDR